MRSCHPQKRGAVETCLKTLVIWLVLKPNLVSRLQEEDYIHKATQGQALARQMWGSCSEVLGVSRVPDGMKPWATHSSCISVARVGSSQQRRKGDQMQMGFPSSGGIHPPDFRCLMRRVSTRPLQPVGPGIPAALQGCPSLWGGCWGHLVPTPTSTSQMHEGFSEPFWELQWGSAMWLGWAELPGIELLLPAGSQEDRGGR